MAEKLLSAYKTRIQELTLQPSGGGRFEVFVDGQQVFSKAETGRFPKVDEIQQALPVK